MSLEEAKTRSDILVEFLEVAFHSILYFRNIYPPTIFHLKKKYDIPIHVSIHPKVNEYIMECLKTAKGFLESNSVKQIALVIVTSTDRPVEKYVFEIQQSDSNYTDRYFVKAEVTFREYLLKLSVAGEQLRQLPDDCSFTVEMTTSEQTSVRLNESVNQAHFPWIEADREDPQSMLTSILPLKTLDTSLLKLVMYIER